LKFTPVVILPITFLKFFLSFILASENKALFEACQTNSAGPKPEKTPVQNKKADTSLPFLNPRVEIRFMGTGSDRAEYC
jgi:hypothetical protein